MDKAALKILIPSIMLVIMMSISAFAQPTGAEPTLGTSEKGEGTASGQAPQQSGNITEVNVSGISITAIWGGFYGIIGGNVQLGDSSGHRFFEWSVQNFSNSVVYAANGTVNDWDLKAIDYTLVPEYVADGNDGFNNTFTERDTFMTESIGPIADTPFTRTYQNGAAGSLRTYALVTQDNSVNIWAGIAIQNTSSFKPGERVDYQIICPALESGTTYKFYMELP